MTPLRNLTLSIVTSTLLLAVPAAFAEESTLKETPTPDPLASRAKGLNPDTSLNILGLFQRGTSLSDDRTSPPFNGPSIQEAELQLSADIDPYFRGVARLGLHQESGTTEFHFDPEELFIETLAIPSVTIKAGRFKLAIGRHNSLHTHAYPFIDAPRTQESILGEGLAETGIAAAVLLPLSWYSELTLQAFAPSNEELFLSNPSTSVPGSPNSGEFGGLAKLKNLWDLNDDLTLELGMSGLAGRNALSLTSTAAAADLTVKWRPATGGKYKALIWSSEYLSSIRRGLTESNGADAEKLSGFTSALQFQFSQRWWVQARWERLGVMHSAAITPENKITGLIGFFPSEFSGIRLQYDRLSTLGGTAEHTGALQYNVSIGAHPAHTY